MINIVWFGIVVYLLIKSTNLDLKKHTISHLGEDKKYGKLFNISLIVFAFGQVIFAVFVSDNFAGKFRILLVILFVLGGLYLFLAGIFTTDKHYVLHKLTSILSGIAVSIGVILLSIVLIIESFVLAFLTLTGTVVVAASYSIRNKLTGAYWEFLLFAGICVWNIVLSFLLIL